MRRIRLKNSCFEIFLEAFKNFQNICSLVHRAANASYKAARGRYSIITLTSISWGLEAPTLSLLRKFRCTIYNLQVFFENWDMLKLAATLTSQSAFTCSKLTIEVLEQGVKY